MLMLKQQAPLPVEQRLSIPRWQGFTSWLTAGFLGPIPDPTLPPQQWLRLPSHAICMMAQAADEWVQVVLRERQQRGLAWNEERDAPLFAADLTARLLENWDMPSFPGWVACLIEQEMRRLIRILEAPERLLPCVSWMGLPYEARYHALALGLARVCQLYVALEEQCERGEAPEELRAAAARVRKEMTGSTWAA